MAALRHNLNDLHLFKQPQTYGTFAHFLNPQRNIRDGRQRFNGFRVEPFALRRRHHRRLQRPGGGRRLRLKGAAAAGELAGEVEEEEGDEEDEAEEEDGEEEHAVVAEMGSECSEVRAVPAVCGFQFFRRHFHSSAR